MSQIAGEINHHMMRNAKTRAINAPALDLIADILEQHTAGILAGVKEHMDKRKSEARSTGFDAADMATAAASGFRDGAAKEQQAGAFQAALDIRTAQGWKLGGDKVPVLYTDEINGQQVCRDDVWLCTTEAFTHPSPPEGMAGWQPIETAPKDWLRVILTEGGRVFRGVFVTVEFKEHRDGDGNYIDQTDPDAYWMDLASGDVCYPTHWQPEAPLPPPPSSAQKD